MKNGTPSRHGSGADPIHGLSFARHEGEKPAADELWREHGWALDGSTVAVLVGAILTAACVIQVFG